MAAAESRMAPSPQPRPDLVDRQRRAVFVSSLLLLAAIVFEIRGTRISVGGLRLDFHSHAWLYAILIAAWMWETYRYWLVERPSRTTEKRELRRRIMASVPRAELEKVSRPVVIARIRAKHKIDAETLDKLELKGFHFGDEAWFLSWEWSHHVGLSRPKDGSEQHQITPTEVPDLYDFRSWREHARDLYLTERIAPWLVAGSPLVAFLFYRLPLELFS